VVISDCGCIEQMKLTKVRKYNAHFSLNGLSTEMLAGRPVAIGLRSRLYGPFLNMCTKKADTSKYNIGRAMAQAVSRGLLTTESRVCGRVSPCGICGGQSDTEAGFPPSF
jgi:hypothetical protein